MKKLFILVFFVVACVFLCHAKIVKGDVNGDGSVTSVDVTVLYNYLLNGDTSNLANGDVTSDGAITSNDVTFVYNILLGIEPAEDEHEYVDLGLPSGTLWATTNVGAENPEDYGDYFAWGETEQKEYYNWSTYMWCDGSSSTLTKYCTNSYYGYTDDITELDPEDDAATANWGEEWCLPSKDQIQELKNNCTTEWTTMNGVNGCLFTSNINGASLFLPAAGYRFDSGLSSTGECGYYWSRSLRVEYPVNAYDLYLNSVNVDWSNGRRDCGRNVRAVRVLEPEPEHEYVDMGLPSGTLWATTNVGADKPEDYGDYFAWGETAPKENYSWSTYQWCNGSYGKMTKYCTQSSYGNNGFTDNKTELDTEDDAATANWGAEWCMPSKDQIQELMDNCTTLWITRNGVNGRLFTSNINGATMFIPASGFRDGRSLDNVGSSGSTWSRTLDVYIPDYAYYLSFGSEEVIWYGFDRSRGRNVRPVRVQPGHEYVNLGLPSGTLWATMNVGANSPEDYGDYFAWGETTPKDVYNWSTYNWCNGSSTKLTKYCTISSYGNNGFTDNNTELDPEDDAATANWGAEWCMPSSGQIQELINNCAWQWTSMNGVNGYQVTSNHNGTSLFLPAAGYRWANEIGDTGTYGFYWLRTLNIENPRDAYSMDFGSDGVDNMASEFRRHGFSVRAVRVPQK